MFIVSQLILSNGNVCSNDKIPSYSILIGVLLYASLYLYSLTYNPQLLTLLSKFLIYIISVDLLLSAFYHYKLNQDYKSKSNDNVLNENNHKDDLLQNLFDLQPSNHDHHNCESSDDSSENDSVHEESVLDNESVLTNLSCEINEDKDNVEVNQQENVQNVQNQESEMPEELEEDLKKQLELMNQNYIETITDELNSKYDMNEIVEKKKRGRKPKAETQVNL